MHGTNYDEIYKNILQSYYDEELERRIHESQNSLNIITRPTYELPIYIEKLDLFELFHKRLPKELCTIIENARIDIIINQINKIKPTLPFNVCHVIRYNSNCKLLRSKERIINQLRCGSTILPKISHTILYLSNEDINTCIEYLEAIIKRQEYLAQQKK